MKRTLAAVAIAATLTALGAGAAQATETYPAPVPPSTVSAGTVEAGNTVTFSGSGFTPGEQIIITADAGSGAGSGAAGAAARSVAFRVPTAPLTITTQADAAGKFSVDVSLAEAGVYTLTAKGVTSGVTTTNVVTVKAPAIGVASQSSPQGGLPETGADASMILWGLVGAGAVAAGVTSLVLVRRRSEVPAS